MFSATFSNEIRSLGQDLLHNPAFVEASPRNAAANTVKQWVYPVDQKRKPELLSHLVHHHGWEQVLVFTRTKHGANRVAAKLEQDGISAAAIHGNKSQGARTKALADFKQGGVRVLVATDIASRGLDIEQLPHVVNFDLPNVAEDYVHRIGRTGRAGANGHAVSLVSIDEKQLLTGIEKLIRQVLPREMVEGFEPDANIAPAPLTQKHSRPPVKPSVKKSFGSSQDKSTFTGKKPSTRPTKQPSRAGAGR
jgi:ATP-dependent RNA helicase RhlE